MKISKYKISFIMAEKDLMQKDLAELAGMSRGNLSNLINGKNYRPRTAFRIAKALNVGVEEILDNKYI